MNYYRVIRPGLYRDTARDDIFLDENPNSLVIVNTSVADAESGSQPVGVSCGPSILLLAVVVMTFNLVGLAA